MEKAEHPSVSEFKIIPPAISSSGVYLFTTDHGIIYEVRFGRRQDNILYAIIVFGVINDEFDGEEYSLTNMGDIYKVMRTIVKVVKLFMEQHPTMACYEFTGISREGESEDGGSARINLYKRYLPQIFDDHWKFEFKGNTAIVSRKR